MSEEWEYDRFAKLKDKPFQKAMLILAEGAMAFGEGMTKAPYYSNYMEQYRDKAKMAYERWKAERVAEASRQLAGGDVQGVRAGQSPMVGSNISTNSPFVTVPVPSVDEFGNIVNKPKLMANPAFKAEEKSRAEVDASKRSSSYNLDLVAQNMYDMGDVLAKSWEQGGAGNLLKKGLTKAAQKGFVIGDAQSYKSSGSLVGKRTEIVSKMLPMLTQQIGKEGSVRLVESIFTKLGQTIPDEATPPELAKDQMIQSILSMYRTRRALEQIDTKGIKDMGDDKLDSFATEIAMKAGQIELTPKEQESLDELINKSLKPLNKYYYKKGMNHMLKDDYNKLRSQGLTIKQAKERLGL